MFDSVKPEFKLNEKTVLNRNLGRKPRRPFPWKPVVLAVAIPLLVISVLWPSFNWLKGVYLNWRHPAPSAPELASDLPRLANSLPNEDNAATSSSSNFEEKVKIEYLSFNDFYKAPSDDYNYDPPAYSLPINSKTEVANYYEVSRQFNLDPVLANLNQDGLAFITNPWDKDIKDFYGLYKKLAEQKVPILVTNDFITYHYQNNLKQIFKDIEENVFYENLWNINKDLYMVAKKRYEDHAAQANGSNDPVLEAERLELAYLAVALELLKPTAAQINSNKDLVLVDKFNSREVEYFNFPLPAYLQADVSRELGLIREAKEKAAKSPVMSYPKNYTSFAVPAEYRSNARLNNFYLSLRWLNSVWPLNYKSEVCPDCLLDKDDWRINLTAASFLAKDFAADPQLKQRWARIYKIMSFFKGLRDDFSYVLYHDRLVALFGADYNPVDLFSASNNEAEDNLDKLRQDLLNRSFIEIAGGFNGNEADTKPDLGLKIIADFYWPNDYIFKNLTRPAAGDYIGGNARGAITACRQGNAYQRCYGIALDAISLIYPPLAGNQYWQNNISYANYDANIAVMRDKIDQGQIWHANNYWSTLAYLKTGLENNFRYPPAQAASQLWQSRYLNGAVATWINLQLPLDKLSLQSPGTSGGLKTSASIMNNVYVEPNLGQLDELIAQAEMLQGMFQALNLSEEANIVNLNLRVLLSQLQDLRGIIKKELSATSLSPEDKQTILNFIQSYKTEQLGNKQLTLNFNLAERRSMREDLSRLKFMLLVSEQDGRLVMSVGPVFDYQESRPQ
ncbi:MAG: DUF3160 domain-containing protein [Patescibacteria group bacterium]